MPASFPLRALVLHTAFAFGFAIAFAAPAWSQDSGWTGQPGNSRYGSNNSGASSRYGATSTDNLAPIASPPVTPITPASPAPAGGMTAVGNTAPTRARVTKGSGALPRDHGQVWREYDIRPYTLRISDNEHPEQVIVDWVLRETGYEAWHSETLRHPVNANRETLTRLPHAGDAGESSRTSSTDSSARAPAKQRAFSTADHATVRNPELARRSALGMMTPIQVQSPGLQALGHAQRELRRSCSPSWPSASDVP